MVGCNVSILAPGTIRNVRQADSNPPIFGTWSSAFQLGRLTDASLFSAKARIRPFRLLLPFAQLLETFTSLTSTSPSDLLQQRFSEEAKISVEFPEASGEIDGSQVRRRS